jgi:hypothetical protein
MLALFGLRLAFGLAAALLLIPTRLVNPRFYRVQFLTALGLTAAAAMLLHPAFATPLWLGLAAALALCFAGSVLWSLDGAPGGRTAIGLSAAALAAVLALAAPVVNGLDQPGLVLAGEYTSAALLGTATTAMLMGHSYLIAPSMSLTPLLSLLGALVGAIFLRASVAALGLWFWTAGHWSVTLKDETFIWLPLRWVVGFVGPLVLTWMAWQSARIRSTQSATGILYVAVIFCFLGELTSQLLLSITGHVL